MLFLAQLPNAPQLPPLPEGPDLSRVRGPVEIPTIDLWAWVIASSLALAFAVFVIWLILHLRNKPKQSPSPKESAQARLAAIAENCSDESFANESSNALRRYLEDELHLKFTTRTNVEFLRSLKGNTALDSQFKQDLSDLLADFDAIKFAQKNISNERRHQILDTIHRLIEQAHAVARQKEEVLA